MEQLIDRLMGTPASEVGVLEHLFGEEFNGVSIEDLPGENVDEFDNRVALCDGCGWWWPAEELDGDNFCPECTEEDTDEG